MPDSPRRISPATVFFALLALALGIALYVKTRPVEPPSPEPSRRSRSRPVERRPPPTAVPGPARAPEPSPRAAGRDARDARIAIVIDDLGNDREALERIAEWRYAVAGAVLPGLPESAAAARHLARSGKEVLLHLPMEPDGYPRVRPGPGVVLRSDSDERIAEILAEDLESVPGAVGVNNHMGSAATADPRVMRAVVRVLADRGLFLLDSRTTEASVARRMAEEISLPAISRRVFLDSVPTADAIGRSFSELLSTARKDGFALAIGHPYPETMAMLERELPLLAERGVKLVRVSSLVSRSPRSSVLGPQSAGRPGTGD